MLLWDLLSTGSWQLTTLAGQPKGMHGCKGLLSKSNICQTQHLGKGGSPLVANGSSSTSSPVNSNAKGADRSVERLASCCNMSAL